MDKEEKRRLELEYRKIRERNTYEDVLIKPLYVSLVLSSIIFWLPKDILSQYPSLRYFTEFMGSIFPNILIYSQASKVPELTEFYFSYMWIMTLIMVIGMLFLISKANEEAKKYFGVEKYKGRRLLSNKYFIFVPIFTSIKYFIYNIILFLGIGYAIYSNYIGTLINGSLFRLELSEAISAKFGMFIIGNIFQVGTLFLFLFSLIIVSLNTKYIKELKKENR